LGEAHKLFDEVSNMLTEMWQEVAGWGQAAVILSIGAEVG
jgi:hypothetical protein